MAGINWGMAAGGAQDAMQQMLEQRILEEKMALAQRQQQAEEAYRAAQLAEQAAGRGDVMSRHKDTFGQQVTEWKGGEAGRAADVRFKGVQADTGEYNLGRAKTTDANQDAADEELNKNPTTAGLVRFRRAGIPITATDPNDVTGDVEQARGLERIKASGDQNVRSANAARDNRTVTIKTVDEAGNPVTKVISMADAIGQDFDAQPTAEVRNRASAGKRANGVISAVDELSARINTQGGLLAKMSGGASKLAAQANYNDDVAEYESLVSGFTPMVARSLGHTGVLTEQDVASVRKVFPDPGDSKSVRDRKMNRLKSLVAQLNGPEDGAASEAPTAAPAVGKKFTITKVQ